MSTKFSSRKSRIEHRSSPPNKSRTSVIGLSDVSSGGAVVMGLDGWADTITRDPVNSTLRLPTPPSSNVVSRSHPPCTPSDQSNARPIKSWTRKKRTSQSRSSCCSHPPISRRSGLPPSNRLILGFMDRCSFGGAEDILLTCTFARN
jgi:hypothetical protein